MREMIAKAEGRFAKADMRATKTWSYQWVSSATEASEPIAVLALRRKRDQIIWHHRPYERLIRAAEHDLAHVNAAKPFIALSVLLPWRARNQRGAARTQMSDSRRS